MKKVLRVDIIQPSIDGKLYLCHTCQRALKGSKIPTQAVANHLELHLVPPQLADLNDLEVRLIAQRTPFMKLVALPKGQQKGIHGPCVNVPSGLHSICKILPRLSHQAEIIPLQFKCRLRYRANYMYKHIRPQRIMTALRWLKRNNPLYSNIPISETWETDWQADNRELFEALTTASPEAKQEITKSADTTYKASPSMHHEVVRTLKVKVKVFEESNFHETTH